ncbi:MAG TPA: amidohydrolase family protein, partial [Pyrinomonadaceae bacterium]
LAGITSVGEFHYLHRTATGAEYDDPNLLSKEVVRAARDVGLRIALLRVAYARPGHATESNPKQARFIEKDAGIYVRNLVRLSEDLERAGDSQAWAGVALHSVRALPPEYLREAARFLADEGSRFPVHMHVAEQPAEVSACLEEYGQTPVFALDALGLLNERFTAIHAIHITDEEARKLARASSHVCVCPTTERNLGDGVFSHAEAFLDDRRLALGTDSQAQVDLLEDARELELHMRLRTMGRAVLAPQHDDHASALARRLFDCATLGGASSIQSAGGELAPGRPADFFTVALDDPSIAGASAEDLLAAIVFSLERTAVREVFVGGRAIVEDGKHRAQEEIVGRFAALQKRLWG